MEDQKNISEPSIQMLEDVEEEEYDGPSEAFDDSGNDCVSLESAG